MFMVFDSGRPQPSDLFLVLIFLLALRPAHIALLTKHVPLYVAFVGWVVLLNGLWGLYRQDDQYVIRLSFQVYNLGLFALVFKARTTQSAVFDRWARRAIGAAAIGQMVLAASPTGFRATGTFNNSNQLAYWCICMAVMYMVTARKRSLFDLVVLGPLAWVSLLSLSRAGIIAFGLVMATWLWELLRRSPHRVIYGAAILAAVGLLTTLPAFGTFALELEVADSIEARFTKDSATDEVALRNTDRISHYPEYALVGAGEGDFSRFPHTHQIEIHSTPMTIVFSYGLIGVVTFVGFILTIGRRVSLERRLLIVSLFTYSITHNGMRFPFFWLALAVIAAEPWALAADGLKPSTRTSKRV